MPAGGRGPSPWAWLRKRLGHRTWHTPSHFTDGRQMRRRRRREGGAHCQKPVGNRDPWGDPGSWRPEGRGRWGRVWGWRQAAAHRRQLDGGNRVKQNRPEERGHGVGTPRGEAAVALARAHGRCGHVCGLAHLAPGHPPCRGPCHSCSANPQPPTSMPPCPPDPLHPQPPPPPTPCPPRLPQTGPVAPPRSRLTGLPNYP